MQGLDYIRQFLNTFYYKIWKVRSQAISDVEEDDLTYAHFIRVRMIRGLAGFSVATDDLTCIPVKLKSVCGLRGRESDGTKKKDQTGIAMNWS